MFLLFAQCMRKKPDFRLRPIRFENEMLYILSEKKLKVNEFLSPEKTKN